MFNHKREQRRRQERKWEDNAALDGQLGDDDDVVGADDDGSGARPLV